MKKRQDSDIFGTKHAPVAHIIKNDDIVDPNAAFQRQMDQNYDKYLGKVQNTNTRFKQKSIYSQVNQKANFDSQYHKLRKQHDLQSSIFYPPAINQNKTVQNFHKNETKQEQGQKNFGRKQTLNREVNNLPENIEICKGNSSRLFGFDEKQYPENRSIIYPLIPHKMQWDQYDSVRYEGNNNKPDNSSSIFGMDSQITISESKSIVIQEKNENIKFADNKTENPENNLFKKKKIVIKQQENQPKLKQVSKNEQKPKNKDTQSVQIKILNGWNHKFMEGLSKQCKINNTNILKFQFEGAGKGLLVLQKSKRWESVSDWLRKEAKLKMRIMN